MTKARLDLISLYRRNQPIEELERKSNKASGRCSKTYWTAEELDLSYAKAKVMADYFSSNIGNENLLDIDIKEEIINDNQN